MKILILVCFTTWAFGQGFNNMPSTEIVSSEKDASIMVYKSNTISEQIHNTDKHEWKLYEINLNTKEIKIIEIPILKFEPRPNLH